MIPDEMDRTIIDFTLQLEAFICGYCPVQAHGTVHGKRFYFRSRWNHWTFGLAIDPETDPIDIDYPEQGFLRESDYGVAEYDASWMSLDDAERIIRECAIEYINEMIS